MLAQCPCWCTEDHGDRRRDRLCRGVGDGQGNVVSDTVQVLSVRRSAQRGRALRGRPRAPRKKLRSERPVFQDARRLRVSEQFACG